MTTTGGPISATHLRVAVFLWNDDGLVQAVVEAGLEIAYFYDADFGTEHVDFDDIPPFDLVAASLPDDESERKQAWELALLFIRARTPVSFMMTYGESLGSGKFLETVRQKAEALGYRMLENVEDEDDCTNFVIVGTLQNEFFAWPPGVVTERQRTDEEKNDAY
jgi:hypothetical protein